MKTWGLGSKAVRLGGTVGGIPGSLLGAPPKPVPPPPPPPPKPHAPVFVSMSLQQAKLLRMVQPVYPKLARESHLAGDVVLRITVDEEGNVTNEQVLSGNPLLIQAAIDAVKQWAYAPTILDGEPVPVIAIVTVHFTLQ